jgi:hypothetical protein
MNFAAGISAGNEGILLMNMISTGNDFFYTWQEGINHLPCV